MKKPLIGIVGKHVDMEFFGWTAISISDNMRLAVINAGGMPIGILPTTRSTEINETDAGDSRKLTFEEKSELIELVDKCDGIILQGGKYSEHYEEFIASYVNEKNIPVLGVCAGYNNLIRGVGGVIHRAGNDDVHYRPEMKYAHSITIDPSSKLFDIFGVTELQVNSIHNYSPKNVVKLKITAMSEDNIIEAVEDPEKDFYIGLKFHPEILPDDKNMIKVFDYFINACKKNKKEA